MTIRQIAPGIVADSQDSVTDRVFFNFVKDTVSNLGRTTVGARFLREFRCETNGLNGGIKYPNASVVIRAPSPIKIQNMQSVAETGHLHYSPLKFGQLKVGAKSPARIDVFYPGAVLPGDFSNKALRGAKISVNGDFQYYSTQENISDVLMHELIHAYYYVIGAPEPATDQEDERRAVGIYEFKDAPYTENRFRAALGKTIRFNYERLRIPDDPALIMNPWYFGPPEKSVNKVWADGHQDLLVPGIANPPFDRDLLDTITPVASERQFRQDLDTAISGTGGQKLRVIIFGPRSSWGDDMTWWVATQIWSQAYRKARAGLHISRSFFEHGTRHVRLYKF